MSIFDMKGRVMVGVAIFLGLLLVFYVMVYKPQIIHKNNLEIKISQQNRRLLQLREKYRELEQLKEENKKIKNNLAALESKLKEGRVSFLYELGFRGKIYGVEYLEITPLSTIEEKYYLRTPVKMHLFSKYHNFGMLISDMAKKGGLGAFTVDNVLLKSTSREGYTIEASLILSLYRYKGLTSYSSETVATSLSNKISGLKSSKTGVLRRKR